jgi:hypothetical protein
MRTIAASCCVEHDACRIASQSARDLSKNRQPS